MNSKKEQTIEQLINAALTEEQSTAQRMDTLQRDHQTKMAALYEAYNAEVSQIWRRI